MLIVRLSHQEDHLRATDGHLLANSTSPAPSLLAASVICLKCATSDTAVLGCCMKMTFSLTGVGRGTRALPELVQCGWSSCWPDSVFWEQHCLETATGGSTTAEALMNEHCPSCSLMCTAVNCTRPPGLETQHGVTG